MEVLRPPRVVQNTRRPFGHHTPMMEVESQRQALGTQFPAKYMVHTADAGEPVSMHGLAECGPWGGKGWHQGIDAT